MFHDAFTVKGVRAVNVDVLIARRPYVSQVFFNIGIPLCLKLVHAYFELEGVPINDNVAEQVEAPHLMVKLLIRFGANFPLIAICDLKS